MLFESSVSSWHLVRHMLSYGRQGHAIGDMVLGLSTVQSSWTSLHGNGVSAEVALSRRRSGHIIQSMGERAWVVRRSTAATVLCGRK